MTTKADWAWRAEFLSDAADRLETKADELKDEARRYRGLAEQSRALVRLGDNEGWQPMDNAPRGRPIQVWAQDKEHHWLPFTAWYDGIRWARPATADNLPYEPTHWRELPTTPATNGQSAAPEE